AALDQRAERARDLERRAAAAAVVVGGGRLLLHVAGEDDVLVRARVRAADEALDHHLPGLIAELRGERGIDERVRLQRLLRRRDARAQREPLPQREPEGERRLAVVRVL